MAAVAILVCESAIATVPPLPKHSYAELAPTFRIDDSETEVLARGVLVYHGLLYPDLANPHLLSAVAVDITFHRDRAIIGFRDAVITQLSGMSHDWGILGGGFVISLPTATRGELAAGGLRIGPAVFAQTSSISHLELSALVRTLFATAGRFVQATALVTEIEPGIAVDLPANLALVSDATIEIDWLAGDASVPVNLQLSRAFGRYLVVQLGPQVDLVGPTRGAVTLALTVDVVAP